MDLFKEIAWDELVKLALAKLFEKFAFLSFWPVSAIVSWIVIHFTNILYVALDELVDLKMILFRNREAWENFSKASVVLMLKLDEFGKDSEEYKNAKANAKTTVSAFLRWDALRK